MKNPGATFGTPEALEAASDFTAEQKRAILLQWKDQLRRLQTASNESMTGPESNGTGAECMRRVVDALIRLES
ncbi:hypothetical protein [Povalibacter sp.]|uniref:hypothetical protein n=1 Tax=Povalibacter sp. TaxID=1962978 RepID=UPI002D1FB531|nr:hypothetical protein [Povalibacter sp.]